jgi:hypothetical protein
LRARFDRILKRASTGYVTLDRLLGRLFRNKDGLLRVLERPEIPINANASENDIRAFVTKRKISGGTVSDKGRDARDIMLGLAKTCMKLKLSFYEFIGDRLGIKGPNIPPLASLIRRRSPGNLPRLRAPLANSRKWFAISAPRQSLAPAALDAVAPCFVHAPPARRFR